MNWIPVDSGIIPTLHPNPRLGKYAKISSRILLYGINGYEFGVFRKNHSTKEASYWPGDVCGGRPMIFTHWRELTAPEVSPSGDSR